MFHKKKVREQGIMLIESSRKQNSHTHTHTHAYTHPFLRGCAVRAYNKKPDNNTEWHLRVGTEYSPAQNSVGGVPGYAT